MIKRVLGVDPGFAGGFLLTDGSRCDWWGMPIVDSGKEKRIDFGRVLDILHKLPRGTEVFLERAHPGGQGVKAAFSYGRGFECLVLAIETTPDLSVTHIEPAKWAKEMHQGIAKDLKPKAKSLIAAKRLYPKLYNNLPKNRNDKVLDGAVDALLIAGFGLRLLGRGPVRTPEKDDFF